MRAISEFEGIKIIMEFRPRFVPFVQASCGYINALFSIETTEMIDVINGKIEDFPYKEKSLVSAWITIHQQVLMENWKRLELNPNAFLERIMPLI
jgi:hypothetical protein